MDWLKHIDTFIFGGGGIRGIATIGALEEWERFWEVMYQKSIYRDIRYVSGSSIGSIIALLIAAKVPLATMKELFLSPLWNALYQQIDIFKLVSEFGLIDHRQTFAETISGLLANPNETFAELHTRTGVSLTVCVTNLTTGQAEYHSDEYTPNYSIAPSILASCAIPLIFPPVQIHGHLFIDGSIVDNLPVPLHINYDTTLAFRLCDAAAASLASSSPVPAHAPSSPLAATSAFFQHLGQLLFVTLRFIEEERLKQFPKSFASHILHFTFDATQIRAWSFHLTQDQRLLLYQNGQISMHRFLTFPSLVVGELLAQFSVLLASPKGPL